MLISLITGWEERYSLLDDAHSGNTGIHPRLLRIVSSGSFRRHRQAPSFAGFPYLAAALDVLCLRF
jgi:hypothetical protein